MLKRLAQALCVVTIAFTMLGATGGVSNARLDEIGNKLVCQCGCTQGLMVCNHVGCPVSGPMIASLRKQLAAGDTEAVIIQNFITKYGPVVLAAPIRGGFDDIAWIVPYAVLFLGTVGVAFLIVYWRRRNLLLHPATAEPLPPDDDLRARIRRDTDLD